MAFSSAMTVCRRIKVVMLHTPPGPSEALRLPQEVRGFDTVPAVPGGLQLTRVARQGRIHQDAMVQRLVDFGELVFPPTPLFEVSEMGT